MQQVNYGRTLSGKEGLFTYGTLVYGFFDGCHSRLTNKKWCDLTLDDARFLQSFKF